MRTGVDRARNTERGPRAPLFGYLRTPICAPARRPGHLPPLLCGDPPVLPARCPLSSSMQKPYSERPPHNSREFAAPISEESTGFSAAYPPSPVRSAPLLRRRPARRERIAQAIW